MWIGEAAAVVNFANEMLDHFFRDFKIGNNAVAQRANSLNITRCTPQHQLGLVPDRQNMALTLAVGNGEATIGAFSCSPIKGGLPARMEESSSKNRSLCQILA